MNIGEVAQKTGLERSAIRFYEQQGVVPEPSRSDSGYRTYTDSDLDLIRFVKRGRSLGMSLDDIRSIVDLRNNNEAPCATVREIISNNAESIAQRIGELQDLHHELIRLKELADDTADDWPNGSCVCHIVETAPIQH
jgi:DNA-binding transcriptional MerR regulator